MSRSHPLRTSPYIPTYILVTHLGSTSSPGEEQGLAALRCRGEALGREVAEPPRGQSVTWGYAGSLVKREMGGMQWYCLRAS